MRPIRTKLSLSFALLVTACAPAQSVPPATPGPSDRERGPTPSDPSKEPPPRGEGPAAQLTASQRFTIEVTRQEVVEGKWQEVPFPRADVEAVGPLTAPGKGMLELARSRDGSAVWVQAVYDDGKPYISKFAVPEDQTRPNNQALQFVDCVLRQRESRKDSRHTFGGIVQVADGSFYELLSEAWYVDVAAGKAIRPETQVEYDLRAASGGQSYDDARALQWMAFVPTCGAEGTPCVYFGEPLDVAAAVRRDSPGRICWLIPDKDETPAR